MRTVTEAGAARRPHCYHGMHRPPSLFTIALTAVSLLACAGSSEQGGSGEKADDEFPDVMIESVDTRLDADHLIRWPRAVGGDVDVASWINSELAFWKVTRENLENITTRWASEPEYRTVVGSTFDLDRLAGGILSLTIHYDTEYAYPESHRHFANFSTASGRVLPIDQLLEKGSLATLAAKLDVELQRRIAAAKVENRDAGIDLSIYDGHRVDGDDLSRFTVNRDSITFHYQFGFPHALLPVEPDGDLVVSFEALEGYVADDWAESLFAVD